MLGVQVTNREGLIELLSQFMDVNVFARDISMHGTKSPPH